MTAADRKNEPRCDRCGSLRWVEDQPDWWKPCPVCRSDQHARWATGEYDNPRW